MSVKCGGPPITVGFGGCNECVISSLTPILPHGFVICIVPGRLIRFPPVLNTFVLAVSQPCVMPDQLRKNFFHLNFIDVGKVIMIQIEEM